MFKFHCMHTLFLFFRITNTWWKSMIKQLAVRFICNQRLVTFRNVSHVLFYALSNALLLAQIYRAKERIDAELEHGSDKPTPEANSDARAGWNLKINFPLGLSRKLEVRWTVRDMRWTSLRKILPCYGYKEKAHHQNAVQHNKVVKLSLSVETSWDQKRQFTRNILQVAIELFWGCLILA